MNEEIREVVLLDEDGKETRFEHILTFLYEGSRYVALCPIMEDSSMEEDEAEVVMLQIVSENGEDTYKSIESEVLLNEVFDTDEMGRITSMVMRRRALTDNGIDLLRDMVKRLSEDTARRNMSGDDMAQIEDILKAKRKKTTK